MLPIKKSQKMRKIQRATMMMKKMQRVKVTSVKLVMSRAAKLLTIQSYQKPVKTGTRWKRKP